MSEITVQDLFELSLEVNKGTPDVFFRFSGHVDLISIDIYPSWRNPKEKIPIGYFYLERVSQEEIDKTYSDLLEYL